MRITTTMMYSQMTRSLQKGLEDVAAQNAKVFTGKKVSAPSEDVAGTLRAIDYKLNISYNDQYKRNIDYADTNLKFNNTVLTAMTDAMEQLRSSLNSGTSFQYVPSTNPGYDDSYRNRQLYSQQAGQVEKNLLNFSNSKLQGRYIYSGYRSETPAFQLSGSGYDYQGDFSDVNILIDKNTNLPINVTGNEAFGFPYERPTQPNVLNYASLANSRVSARTTGSPASLAPFADAATDHVYQISFNAAGNQMTITDLQDRTRTATAAYTSGQTISFDGIDMVVSGTVSGTDRMYVSSAELYRLHESSPGITAKSHEDVVTTGAINTTPPSLTVSDSSAYTSGSYQLIFTTATQYNVIKDGAEILSNQVYTPGNPITVKGMEISFTPDPAAGDHFDVEAPESKYARFSPLVTVKQQGTTGTINTTSPSLTVADFANFEPGEYELRFTSATTFDLYKEGILQSTGNAYDNTGANPTQKLVFNGIQLNFGVNPAAADVFKVSAPDTGVNVETRDAAAFVNATHASIPADTYSFKNYMEMARTASYAWQYQDTDGSSLNAADPENAASQAINRINELNHALDKAFSQIQNVHSEVSGRQTLITDQTTRITNNTLDYQNALSKTQDADMAETIVALKQAETSLDAIRMSSAKLFSQSLLDYLK